MPLNDWTKVDAGIFHDFHTVWIAEIRSALNDGILPSDYYALAEQHAGQFVADVLTLHAPPNGAELEPAPFPPSDSTGGLAVAEAPPRVRFKETAELPMRQLRRTLSIRHVSSHRVVALLEIVSPSNKDRTEHVEEIVTKTVTAIERGIHVLLVDLFPVGKYDRLGLHSLVRQRLVAEDESSESRTNEPAMLVSYAVGKQIDMYIERVNFQQTLPEMPIFLSPERYIYVPLETTYQAAWRGVPKFWKQVLEASQQ